MRVTIRIPLHWAVLLAFSLAGVVSCTIAWFVLLSTLCSNPRMPSPSTQHVVPYGCHGMQVFISPMDDLLLHWLTPLGLVFIFLSMIAGAQIAVAVARSVRSNAEGGQRARRVRVSTVPPGEAPAWVREKWVGLDLPLTPSPAASTSGLAAGVLSGPRTVFGALTHLVRGRYRRQHGFQVNVLAAIAVLEAASPEAADWWRSHAPHLMEPSRFFLFPEDVCTLVE